jgi:hypothetical protein
MQNIEELRSSLIENYEKLKAREIEIKPAKELANIAGKIINTLRVQLDYNTLTGNTEKIPFLEVKQKAKQ